MGFRTQAQVDRLRRPEGKADAYVWDEDVTGLSVRLQGQARRWVVWYQVGSDRRRMTLGDVAAIPLREARIRAGRIVGDAREGKDALATREAAKAKAANSFGRLIELYLERRAKVKQRPRTLAETERYLMRHWAPLHGRSVDGITRRDVAEQLEEIRANNGPVAANRARVHLSTCFAWALRHGLADANPVVGTEAPAPESKRDRVLSPAEMAAVWRACSEAGDFGQIVQLLMLTGARREEVAGLSWAELDLDRGLLAAACGASQEPA